MDWLLDLASAGELMPVIGYVGLPGSGKTLALVNKGLEARALGRVVYANFQLGSRVDGYLAPTCDYGIHHDSEHAARIGSWCALYHQHCEANGYRFVARSDDADAAARAHDWRKGRAFVPDSGAYVLRSWEDLINLRIFRDPFDVAHQPDCSVVGCVGCSRGITVLLDELNLWAPSRLWQKLGIGVLNRWAYTRKDGLEILWSAQHEARVDKVAREVTDFIWTCKSMGGRWEFKFPFMKTSRIVHFQRFQRTRWIPQLLTDKNRVAVAEGGHADGILGGMFNTEGMWFRQRLADGYNTYEHVSDSGHLKGKVVRIEDLEDLESA